MLWYPMVNRFFPPTPLPPLTNSVSGGSNALERTTSARGSNSLSNAAIAIATAASMNASTSAFPSAVAARMPESPEQTLVFENDKGRYTFTSHGGGIKLAELKSFPELVGSQRKQGPQYTNSVGLNKSAPLPISALIGNDIVWGDGIYQLAKTANGVRAEKKSTNGLSIVKEFHFKTNYLIETSVRYENGSKQAMTVPAHQYVVGTSTPINRYDNNATLVGAIAYNGDKADFISDAWFANYTMGCGLLPHAPRDEYVSGTNIVWGAVFNQFFTVVAIPKEAAPRLFSRKINLPAPTSQEIADDPKLDPKPFGLLTSLAYPEMVLPAGQSLARQTTLYAGPKEYNALARLGEEYKNKLDLVMNFGGFFGFFAKLLLLSMNGLHALHIGYGLAIICITVIIKVLFWPLTNASTRSMKRMGALQPQMAEIKEKYKDDAKKMNMKLMEFMKENKVSPVSGCFPMLLQIPVFFGFYSMLQSAIELRGVSFLWASDLSTADTIFVIPGLGFPVNPLPLIMGVTMLWQSHLTPPSPGMDPVQQKIMKYMPLMFMFFLYSFSAGLTLYWTVQNLLTIAQMKLTKNVTPAVAVRKLPPGSPGSFGARKRKS